MSAEIKDGSEELVNKILSLCGESLKERSEFVVAAAVASHFIFIGSFVENMVSDPEVPDDRRGELVRFLGSITHSRLALRLGIRPPTELDSKYVDKIASMIRLNETTCDYEGRPRPAVHGGCVQCNSGE